MMVRPVRFCYNVETAVDNAFMVNDSSNSESTQAKALQEFENYVSILKSHGVEVVAFDDTLDPHTPDSIFPNNWISFHEDGTVVLYPMKAKNRREERRPDFVEKLESVHNFKIDKKLDITENELNEKYLEGTGSIVFDYINRIAYACISQRTDKQVLEDICAKLGYKAHTFTSVDANNKEIYHTNVMMCVGEKFALVCSQSIPDAKERENLINSLAETGHEIIYLTYDQICHFAGNALEVCNQNKERFLIVSKSGYDSLHEDQLEAIQLYDKIVPIPLQVIETNGGGSARCMIADIRLPKKL